MTGGRGGLTGGRVLLNGPFFSNGTRVFFIHVFFKVPPISHQFFVVVSPTYLPIRDDTVVEPFFYYTKSVSGRIFQWAFIQGVS